MLAPFVVTVTADKFQRKSFGFLHIKPPTQRRNNSCHSQASKQASERASGAGAATTTTMRER